MLKEADMKAQVRETIRKGTAYSVDDSVEISIRDSIDYCIYWSVETALIDELGGLNGL